MPGDDGAPGVPLAPVELADSFESSSTALAVNEPPLPVETALVTRARSWILTSARVPVTAVEALVEVMNKPTCTVEAIAIDTLAHSVHLPPSLEKKDVRVFSLSSLNTFSQTGNDGAFWLHGACVLTSAVARPCMITFAVPDALYPTK